MLAFVNVSSLALRLSDAICGLVTDGGFATASCTQTSTKYCLRPTRPVVLNGIGDIATRSDLLDRSIILAPPHIADDKRRTEAVKR